MNPFQYVSVFIVQGGGCMPERHYSITTDTWKHGSAIQMLPYKSLCRTRETDPFSLFLEIVGGNMRLFKLKSHSYN
jgi:hypothetical protein